MTKIYETKFTIWPKIFDAIGHEKREREGGRWIKLLGERETCEWEQHACIERERGTKLGGEWVVPLWGIIMLSLVVLC